jgi:hypothetical protein
VRRLCGYVPLADQQDGQTDTPNNTNLQSESCIMRGLQFCNPSPCMLHNFAIPSPCMLESTGFTCLQSESVHVGVHRVHRVHLQSIDICLAKLHNFAIRVRACWSPQGSLASLQYEGVVNSLAVWFAFLARDEGYEAGGGSGMGCLLVC